MIEPDAKCINNGKKLNAVIRVLNSILKVAISEEFDVVDRNNQPAKRWLFTGKLTGQKQREPGEGRDQLNGGRGAPGSNRTSLN